MNIEIFYKWKRKKKYSTRHYIKFYMVDEQGVKHMILEQKIPFHDDMDSGHNLKNITPTYYKDGYIHQIRTNRYGKRKRNVKFPVKQWVKEYLNKRLTENQKINITNGTTTSTLNW